MKNLKEQLLEIFYTKKIIGDKDLFELLENGLHEAPLKDYAISSIMEKLASKLESLIKERFVEREFIRWVIFGSHPFVSFFDIVEGKEIEYFTDEIDSKRWSINELYNYWLNQNNKQNDTDRKKAR